MRQKALGLILGCTLLALPAMLGSFPLSSAGAPRLRARGGTAHSSAWLNRQVTHQLRMLAYYSVFDNLEFRVYGYRVELLGQVVRPTLKSDAEAAVKRIEGVEGVINHIEVLPLSPSDDRIRWACYRAIFSSAPLQKYAVQPVPSIHIIVKNGNVTLVGVVDSEMDREVANLQANQVAGAFSVTNKLRVAKHGKST
jgi:osmotically-inducible protein OsmY